MAAAAANQDFEFVKDFVFDDDFARIFDVETAFGEAFEQVADQSEWRAKQEDIK